MDSCYRFLDSPASLYFVFRAYATIHLDLLYQIAGVPGKQLRLQCQVINSDGLL